LEPDLEAFEPSRTAQGAAMHRAAHQLVDIPPVFFDPLALAVIGAEAETALRDGSDWHGLPSNALRAFIAVRSRLAEDTLAEAMARGVAQYVLLGAGLDTFAYRTEAKYPGLTVFEVDHPATQAWKRERLSEARIDVTANVVYAPVDFETETLVDGLMRASFNFSQPAVFAWLGVTPYLLPDTVIATLRAIAQRMQKGSEIVFDFAQPPTNLDGDQRASFTAMADRVAALGEPFRSFFEPELLARELTAVGFSSVEDFDSESLNARYFANRADGLKLRGRAYLMRARV
jgi:methyltransferase (TIGR00027 family)